MIYYLPILIIVFSNIAYHLSAKNVPEKMDSFFFLSLLYLLSGVVSFGIYFVRAGTTLSDFPNQVKYINWVPFVFALGIIGLELGNILMYRVGWNISIGALVSNIILAVALIIVGFLIYKETFTPRQILGVAFCLAGLVLINRH